MAPMRAGLPLALPFAAIWLLLVVGFAAGDEPQADLAEITRRKSEGPLYDQNQNQNQEDYDRHADTFHYQNDLVPRENMQNDDHRTTNISLAGQEPDAALRSVKPGARRFAVGQRRYKLRGAFMDRWNVKYTGDGVQYLALYHGKGKPYVVNMVRAHLLRKLADAFQVHVPALNRWALEPAESVSSEVKLNLSLEISATIEGVYREVDEIVRNSTAKPDASSSSALVAIVSENFLLTVGAGGGRILGYASDHEIWDFTNSSMSRFTFGFNNVKAPLSPLILIHRPSLMKIQYLFMASEPLARLVSERRLYHIVLGAIDQCKKDSNEQEIYTRSIENIFKSVLYFRRTLFPPNFSAILMGINTNHTDIN